MANILKKFIKGDLTIWIIYIFFFLFSSIEMFSMTHNNAIRHIVFLLVGFLIMVGVHTIPYKWLRALSFLFLIASWIFLVYAKFDNVTLNNTDRWVIIFGIQFQPSELAKLALIIVAADFIDRAKKNEIYSDKFFWVLIGVSVFTCGLICIDNFSTALLLAAIVFFMLILGGFYKYTFLTAFGVILLLALLVVTARAFPVVAEYLPDRLTTWTNRVENFTDGSKFDVGENLENLQEVSGKIAIAKGGIFGVFLGNGEARKVMYGHETDFIYASIIEETGLVGGILIIVLFVVLLFRAGVIARRCKSTFPTIVVLGLSSMIVLQALINMFVVVGVIPVTGQPLPFVSHGGTSIIITCIYLGMIQSVARYSSQANENEEFREYKFETENVESLNTDSNENEFQILD